MARAANVAIFGPQRLNELTIFLAVSFYRAAQGFRCRVFG